LPFRPPQPIWLKMIEDPSISRFRAIPGRQNQTESADSSVFPPLENPCKESWPKGPGIGFTPEGCPINFTTCSWNGGIVEYWTIGSKNEILPIEMIKGFIRPMKPILFLSSIIPSLHYSSYSIFRQSQLPLTWSKGTGFPGLNKSFKTGGVRYAEAI
jgi:hypothetical protein